MPTFQVDPEELRLLDKAIFHLSNEIQDASLGAAVPQQAGSHRVTSEAQRFVDEWSDARAKIGRNLDALSTAVAQARVAYDTVECDILSAATPEPASSSRPKDHA